jgi:hypothetical protein
VSSESIASPTSPAAVGEPCAVCGAPLAGDQRYCLECGERRTAMSSVLLGGPPTAASPAPPEAPPGSPPSAPQDSAPRGNAVLLPAGIGVLLLAMGVGVLIGRSGGSSKQTAAAAPQVISVGTTGAAGSSEPAFTDDWPSGKNGYTVQLQTLPQEGTTTSAVQAAKAAAAAKGAKDVGALKSEDFASLTTGSYIVYSGIFKKKPEAAKALAGLKKSFPTAEVISVSSAGASSSGAGKGGSGSSSSKESGVGSSLSHPAPPTVLKELHKTKGKSYEEKSKNLPDVVGT